MITWTCLDSQDLRSMILVFCVYETLLLLSLIAVCLFNHSDLLSFYGSFDQYKPTLL